MVVSFHPPAGGARAAVKAAAGAERSEGSEGSLDGEHVTEAGG